MTDTTGDPYPFDFFETIVGISFPSGGYVLVTTTSFTSTNTATPPPPAKVTFGKLPDKVKLIDHDQRLTKQVTPARDFVTKVFFVFNDVAGPVTLANYKNVVVGNVFPQGLFATQFAIAVGSPTGFKNPEAFGVEPVPEGGDGFFSTAAIAQGYADNWNAHIHGAPAGSGAAVYLSDGSTMDANPAPVSVHEIDVPQHQNASASTTSIERFLFKVPKSLSTFTLKINSPQGSSDVLIDGFHGKTPTSVSAVKLADADTDAETGGNSSSTYTLTSQITKGPTGLKNTVTATGGGTAGAQ